MVFIYLFHLLYYIYLLIFFFSQIFELATGDFLFDPHSGKNYSRDEGNPHNSKLIYFF